MSIFQQSILSKYITANAEKISVAYKLYADCFHNPTIQENIRNSKEEQFQEGFLRELFVKILGYTLNPTPNFNLITEQKNETNSKKADGAILVNGEVIGVIELKDTKTTDLKNIETQAFGYKNYNKKAVYVITSNFEKLRFYIDNAIDYEEFNLFTLTEEKFAVLWLCLAYENIAKNLAKHLKTESVGKEEQITRQLYKDYSAFKRALFDDICEHNKGLQPLVSPLVMFKKTQKLLDRLLFILFAEDGGLLPPNSIMEIVKQWEQLKELDAYTPLYNRLKMYFGYMNTGRKGAKHDIFAYNGGLFAPDEVLDSIVISDEILLTHLKKVSNYDFSSEVDVNILGHIFENSLTEIEEVTNILTPGPSPKGEGGKTSKRKKDGVFYTPRYITAYIVENTIGKLCADKKAELEIDEQEYFTDKKRQIATRKKLNDKLETYRSWLLSLTICDPACGSGAFLNAALDFLMAEHKLIDEMTAKLMDSSIVFPNIENAILENNLYGVDINEESVEIAKLSLWLRTAKPNRKLNALNDNIKCGNSLVSPSTTRVLAPLSSHTTTRELAPLSSHTTTREQAPLSEGIEKAFDWHKEFPQVFKEKEKKAFHITTAIHDSRTSQRMVDYKVREMRAKCNRGVNPVAYADPQFMTEEDEIVITKTIAEIVKEDNLNIVAYNICGDHLHIILVCEEEELDKIVRKLKSKTARACNIARGVTNKGALPPCIHEETLPPCCGYDKEASTTTRVLAPLSTTREQAPSLTTREQAPLSGKKERGEYSVPFWTQKFGSKEITDREQLYNTIEYIENNRIKHELPPFDLSAYNKGACPLVSSIEHAFRTEYKGGFDVVIGNPPYGASFSDKDKEFIKNNFRSYKYKYESYIYFIEKALSLIKSNGYLEFITPALWLELEMSYPIRSIVLNEYDLQTLRIFGDNVFADAVVNTCSFRIQAKSNEENLNIIVQNRDFLVEKSKYIDSKTLQIPYRVSPFEKQIIDKIQQNSTSLSKYGEVVQGITPYDKYRGQSEEIIKSKAYHFDYKYDNDCGHWLDGKDITRYFKSWSGKWLRYGEWLAAPREKRFFEGKRILFREIPGEGKRIQSMIVEDLAYYGHSITPFKPFEKFENDIYFFLGIVNSKLLSWYGGLLLPNLGKDIFPKMNPQDILLLPISLQKDERISSNVRKIIGAQTELQTKRQRFLKRLSDNFAATTNKGLQPLVITKALETFDELDFAQFLSELKKQKIALSLKQQDEWEEYFLDYKTECNSLSAEILATDKEIDALVYGLYGLTEEEIRIIEK